MYICTVLSQSPDAASPLPSGGASGGQCRVTRRAVPLAAVRRLLLLTYFPSGFWSRLLTRLLADDVIVDVIRAYFLVPRQVSARGSGAEGRGGERRLRAL